MLAVIAKKYARQLTDPDDRIAVEKVKAALARRGYGYSEIRDGIAAYFAAIAENYDEEDW